MMATRINKGKIMRKLLGQPTTTTTNETTDINPTDALRPTASQNTVFKARASIACLDRSPDGERVVVAGQKVFKTLKVEGSTITEDVDLRSIITSYATSHDITAATADQLNIRAVRWSHSTLDTTVITACGNGRITLYDLTRSEEGLEVARIHEHARQVHKLDINSFRCNWLLSASHDGTVKSFDLRTPFIGRNGATFRTWHTFKCNADAVRDVKWSPIDGFEFACSTDAGVVQKWDVRKPSAPILKFTAHQTACFSIAWHPDGEHLVSGGMDQHCHVWDVSKSAERGQRPRYTFHTPAPVFSVSWRPAYWSATAKGKRAAQVTVSYDDSNSNRHQTSIVHLWDLARPGMPFKEIEQWDSSPTGLLWNTRDLLWSVHRDGQFAQTDVAFVPQLIDHRSLSTFAFSPTGDVLMLLEERQSPRRRPPMASPEISPNYQNTSNGPILSVSRSDSEEDVVGSFLGPRIRKRRGHSERTQSLSNTPPSNTGMVENKAMPLDDAIKVTGIYKPQQTMAIGHAPSTRRRSTYQYFTGRYLERMAKDAIVAFEDQSTEIKLASTIEYYAQTAESIAHYRLAQTWRLLAYTMNLLLVRRAEFHRQFRLTEKKPVTKLSSAADIKEVPTPRNRGEDTPRRITRTNSPFESPLHPAARTITNEESESTSNVATPLVRPTIFHETNEAMQTHLVEDDVLHLPEPANSSAPDPIPVPNSSQASAYTSSSVEGYDFYGMESFSPDIDFAAPVRKAPLRLVDYSENTEVTRRMQAKRHDSGESFAMFSTSGDSQSRFLGDNSSGSDDHVQTHTSSLRDRVSSWENSLSSHPNHRPSMESLAPTMSESSEKPSVTYSFEARQEVRNGGQTQPRPPTFRIQEASFRSTTNGGRAASPDDSICPWSVQTSTDPNIIENDFLPWSLDPDFLVPAIDPKILIQRSIIFEAQTGALNASVMVLLLRPLLPDGAIDEIQARAILAQYHQRLMSLKLFTEAALLRNLCVPLYPNVFAMAQENITVGFFCTDCHKPLENDPLVRDSQWRCPRCQHAIDGCAVCLQRSVDNPEYDAENAVENTLWWYCPGCGHGGHTMCITAWHADEGTKNSGGCCPLEGCLHPCLPGSWRDQRSDERNSVKQKELDMLVRENSRQGSRGRVVRRDAREVTQSKAVEGVRVTLGLGGGLERKKSLKLVAPGEESAS